MQSGLTVERSLVFSRPPSFVVSCWHFALRKLLKTLLVSWKYQTKNETGMFLAQNHGVLNLSHFGELEIFRKQGKKHTKRNFLFVCFLLINYVLRPHIGD